MAESHRAGLFRSLIRGQLGQEGRDKYQNENLSLGVHDQDLGYLSQDHKFGGGQIWIKDRFWPPKTSCSHEIHQPPYLWRSVPSNFHLIS